MVETSVQLACDDSLSRCLATRIARETARAASGTILDIVGPERVAFVEALRLLGAASGRRRLFLHYPWPLARALAATLESVYPTVLRRASPLNRTQLIMLQEDNVGDGTAAAGLLGHPLRGYREILAGLFGP